MQSIKTIKINEFKADQIIKGQCFIAVNPGNFAENFEDRMQDLMDHCRNMEPVINFILFDK